jgi:hypothetical protein
MLSLEAGIAVNPMDYPELIRRNVQPVSVMSNVLAEPVCPPERAHTLADHIEALRPCAEDPVEHPLRVSAIGDVFW